MYRLFFTTEHYEFIQHFASLARDLTFASKHIILPPRRQKYKKWNFVFAHLFLITPKNSLFSPTHFLLMLYSELYAFRCAFPCIDFSPKKFLSHSLHKSKNASLFFLSTEFYFYLTAIPVAFALHSHRSLSRALFTYSFHKQFSRFYNFFRQSFQLVFFCQRKNCAGSLAVHVDSFASKL